MRNGMMVGLAALAIGLLGGLAGCGGGGDGGADAGGGADVDERPVAVDIGNLAGYWVAVESDAVNLATPYFLHIDAPRLSERDGPEGAVIVEVSRQGEASVGPFVLGEGGAFQLQRASGGSFGIFEYGVITELSRDRLRVSLIPQPGVAPYGHVTFARVDGCGGPGLWFHEARQQVADAAWGPDGSLHLLLGEPNDAFRYYAFASPGRCVPDWGSSTFVAGDRIDVGADGTVFVSRVGGYAGAGGPAGDEPGVWLTEIAARPWERAEVAPERHVLDADAVTGGARPLTATVAFGDGRVAVLWVDVGVLRAYVTQPGGGPVETLEVAVGVPAGGGPPRAFETMEIVPAGEGALVIWLGHGQDAARLEGGALTHWEVPKHPTLGAPTLLAVDQDGHALGAWSVAAAQAYDPQTLIVGRRDASGDWQTQSVGVGSGLLAMAVDPEGTVHIAQAAGSVVGRAHFVHTWVAGDLSPGHWQQSASDDEAFEALRVHRQGGERWARFGAQGELFFATAGEPGDPVPPGVGWRRPALDGAAPVLRSIDVTLHFDAELPVSASFPTLGLSCEADCKLALPANATLPVLLDAGANAASVALSNTLALRGDRGGTALQTPASQTAKSLALTVTARVRRLTVAPVGEEGSAPRILGLEHDPDSGLTWLPTWDTSTGDGRVVGLDAGLTEAVALDLPQLSAARTWAGGGLVTLTREPGGPRALSFYNAKLELQSSQPLAESAAATSLSPNGAIELVYGEGGKLAIVQHTPGTSTAPAQTELVQVESLLGLADGCVVTVAAGTLSNLVRRYTSAGEIGWELDFVRAPYDVRPGPDGSVAILVPYIEAFTVGGVTLPVDPAANSFFPSVAVLRVDGDTGRVTAHREGVFAGGRLAIDEGGAGLIGNGAVSLVLEYVPWDATAEVVRVDYGADLPPGYCLQPGVSCGGSEAFISAMGGGRFAVAWTQAQLYRYDGGVIPGLKRLVTGVWDGSL